MKRYYCTHFDINYTPHARSLAESLYNTTPNSELIMFCMDEASYLNITTQKPANVTAIHYSELESAFPSLSIAKANRSKVEYFYTCSPVICNYVLTKMEGVTEITYLDADLFFFSDPEPIFDELSDSSIGIIEHKFSFFTKRSKVYGNFNVGWITFRNTEKGLACLNSWTHKCIEWCYQRLEDGKYADQKYLDSWPDEFQGVCIIKHIGANLAPWNISNYSIKMKDGRVYVDNKPLLFYHFANLKHIGTNTFRTDLSRVFVRCSGVLRNNIYIPYLNTIIKYIEQDKLIVTKKDAHASGIGMLFRKATRVIRQIIFPDIIKIK